MINEDLLSILRCPFHPEGPPLIYKEPFLICAVEGHAFRIKEGIPDMLPEDVIPASQAESELAQEGSKP